MRCRWLPKTCVEDPCFNSNKGDGIKSIVDLTCERNNGINGAFTYNRTVRYDWLAQNIYDELEEVQSDATRWLWLYNNERPNMAIGGITPKQKLNNVHLTNSTQMHC